MAKANDDGFSLIKPGMKQERKGQQLTFLLLSFLLFFFSKPVKN